MTREEAIEELERLLSHWDDLENGKRSFRWYSKDAVGLALTALRPVSREEVEKVWRGEWTGNFNAHCSLCDAFNTMAYIGQGGNFCPSCGAPMTDEAVEMVMERMEAVYEQDND